MRTLNLKTTTLIVLFSGLFIFSSCKKDFSDFFAEQFPEPTSTSTDMMIDGEFAVPIINTEFTLENFIPNTDSSLWAEVDDNDLVHLRMYFTDVFSFSSAAIYGANIHLPVIPAGTMSAYTDTNKLRVYDNALQGHLFFDNPTFKFIVKNDIPVVTFFQIDTIRLISPAYNETFVRDHIQYHIPSPTTQFSTEDTTIVIDKNVLPDFEEFFSPIPKHAAFNVTVGSNNPQTPIFPLTGNEKLSFDVDIDLPLDAHLVDLVMGDTSDLGMDLDTMQNYEQIQSITIKIILDNEFPAGGVSQVSFADTNNHGGVDDIILDVFEGDGWVFEPAITDANGVTTTSVESSITLEITQEQLTLLKENHAAKIIFTTKLNSHQSDTGQDIKIFGYYKLGVQLGFKVNYAGNTGDIPQP